MVRPVPIPNTAVKHSLADGSGFIDSARVGCRQFFTSGRNTLFRPFFYVPHDKTMWVERTLSLIYVSFVLMHELKLKEFFTTDRHFRQGGFNVLLE